MSNYATLQESINTATFDSDNWNTDGSINWSFVDADAFDECNKLFDGTAAFYKAFNEIVTAIRVQMREEADSEARFEMEML
jgi:hypothetical protein